MKKIVLYILLLSSINILNAQNISDVTFSSYEMRKLMKEEQTREYYKKAKKYIGNDNRIAEAMKKAREKQNLVIGAIGGSITAGANASDYNKTCFAALVAEWWKKKFKIDVQFVNAGIGATNSIYGVHRSDKDLLNKKPDFVLVDFCVNDMNTDGVQESYEGLLRKILKSEKNPGVLSFSLLTNTGVNVQDDHLVICKNYGITMLSQCDALKDIIFGYGIPGSTWEQYSADEVHPNDWGHAVAAAILVCHLEYIYENLDSYDTPNYNLPSPVTFNGYEKSAKICNSDISPALNGWDTYKEGWKATTTTQPLVFDFEAGYITITYLKTNVKGKGGKCRVKVNGRDVTLFNADFTGGWGDYYATETILKDPAIKTNRIEFYPQNKGGEEFIIENILVANYENLTLSMNNNTENEDIRYCLYPNPAKDTATMHLYTSVPTDKADLKLYSLCGQNVMSFASQQLLPGDNIWQIETTNLKNGVYFVVLDLQYSDDSTRIVDKMVVK